MDIKFKRNKTILLIGLGLILIISSFPLAIGANTIKIKSFGPPGLPTFYVNDDWAGLENGTVVVDLIIDYKIGENAFSKIQDALDRALVHDKIFVFQGVYNENLVIRENIDHGEIRGVYSWYDPDPWGENIINGAVGSPVVLVEASSVDIHGFIITNNGADNNGVVDQGKINQIFENTIKNIGGTGVILTDNCVGSWVYYNNFIDNGQNALDNSIIYGGSESKWWYEDEEGNREGNYWDDHPGGLKRDRRVWLRPYSIPGSANSEDLYPWVNLDGKIRSRSVNQLSCLLEKIIHKMLFRLIL